MSVDRASAPPAARTRTTAPAGLSQWRGRILQNTLTATAVLASVAYIPGVLVAAAAGLWLLIVIDTVVWVLVMTLALEDRWPFAVRAIGLIGGWYLIALFLLWIVGPVSSGLAWLLGVPVLAALFFGYRGAAISVALVVVTSVVYYFLLPLHQEGAYLATGRSYDAASWFACAANLAFLSALLSLSIARLLRGLEDSLGEVEVAHQDTSQALAEREQLQEELLQSQKQSALGTLASGIAHDFNNMLVPILMASEEARDDAPAGSPQRQHLDRVITAAFRARNLIRRILDFSRSPDIPRRPVAIEPILRESGALLKSSAIPGVSIHFDVQAPDAHVLADPGEIHQILMNLGTNACLAMKEHGGRLTLSLRRDPGDGTICMVVEDTGPGIPPELQEKVFDPFFTTRESGTGTGLGLSIVLRLVTAMAGTVALDSAPGRGTRFILRFPEVEPEHEFEAREPEENESGEPAPSQANILVVDDEELVRGMIAIILSRNGYRVREASSPESALRQVHDDPGGIDLVITDHAMPYMTGLELTRDLRLIRADLPVVLVSGHLEPDEQEQAKRLGLEAVLDKPFARRTLLETVKQVLRRGASDTGAGLLA